MQTKWKTRTTSGILYLYGQSTSLTLSRHSKSQTKHQAQTANNYTIEHVNTYQAGAVMQRAKLRRHVTRDPSGRNKRRKMEGKKPLMT